MTPAPGSGGDRHLAHDGWVVGATTTTDNRNEKL